MSRKRMTITVQEVKERANRILEQPDNSHITDETRRMLQNFVESILMDTGNYQGFNYVDWLDGGWARWSADGCPFDNTPYRGQDSRIRFY